MKKKIAWKSKVGSISEKGNQEMDTISMEATKQDEKLDFLRLF